MAALQPDLGELTRRWFVLSVEGLEHVSPAPCLYVGNHNGGIAQAAGVSIVPIVAAGAHKIATRTLMADVIRGLLPLVAHRQTTV